MFTPIKETRFNFTDFIQELNQKELVFLLFLNKQEDTHFIKMSANKYESVEHFMQTILKAERKLIHQMPAEHIREMLLDIYKDTDKKLVYRILHEQEEDSILSISIPLHALYCFIRLLFEKKLIHEEYNSASYHSHPDKSEWLKKQQSFFEKQFLIPNKPHTNLLGLLYFIGCTNDFLCKLDESDDDKKPILSRMYWLSWYIGEQNSLIEKKIIETLKTENRQLESLQKRSLKEIEKKKNQLDKTNEQQKVLAEQVKELKQQANHPSSLSATEETALYLSLSQTIQKKEEQVEQYKKDLDNALRKPHPIYENMIEKLNGQLHAVKEDSKEKKLEIKQLCKKVGEYENESLSSFVKRYFEHNEMNAETFSLLKSILSEYEDTYTTKEMPAMPAVTKAIAEHKHRIGYASIEHDVFYVHFPDKTKTEIKQIPPYIYIGENQFVLVSADGTFRWLFNSLYQNEYDYAKHTFVSVNRNEDEVYFLDANGRKVNVLNLPNTLYLKTNQILSVNSNGDFQRYFPTAFANADIHLESIRLKGQEAYYILDSQWNGYTVRHIETGKESFMPLQSDLEIRPYQVVCVDGQIVRYVFHHSQFYTLSSYYTKYQHGTAYLENGIWMVKKLTGETSPLKNVPFRVDFQDGDAITIDEHNQFLRRVQMEGTIGETVESKRLAALTAKPDKIKKMPDIPLSKKVLIIGKITYEESYRTAFRKKGFYTEIVDGYLPWSRVKSKTKNQNIIVVVTQFVSHENMWQIKEENLDIPIIFSESDGANQIAERLNA